MSNEFPLVKRLGLEVVRSQITKEPDLWTVPYVSAQALESLLAQAPVVSIEQHKNFGWTGAEKDDGELFDSCTHTALLLGIQPIIKDTAESLLRELVSYCEEIGFAQRKDELYKRAKALLEKKP